MNYQLTDQTGYNIAAILRSRCPQTSRQFQNSDCTERNNRKIRPQKSPKIYP